MAQQRRSRSMKSPAPYTRRAKRSASPAPTSKDTTDPAPVATTAGGPSSSSADSSATFTPPSTSFTFEPPTMPATTPVVTATPTKAAPSASATSSTVPATSSADAPPTTTAQHTITAPAAPRPAAPRPPVVLPRCPPIKRADGTPDVTTIPPYRPATDSSARRLYIQQLHFHFNSLLERHREAWSNLMFYSRHVSTENSYLKSAQYNVERLHNQMQDIDASFRFHLQNFEAPTDPYWEHYQSVIQAFDARMNEYAHLIIEYNKAWLIRFQPPDDPKE
ncbi:hypothetical protein BGW42_006608 [Actinomortierella wolfii]|nr:hypothetical protein BGW42_006608 [Actinomortierella wolfii]